MTDRSRDEARSRKEPDVSLSAPQLTDEQWLLIADLLIDPPPDPRGGRPRVDARRCLEGILWVLRSGARWKDLPRSFPSYVTCWRRFVEWSGEGVWDEAWRRLAQKLDERGRIDWKEGFADGTFASAKKGGIWSGRPSGAKEPSSCSWSTEPACRCRSTLTRPAALKSA
jgi:transposase